MPDSKDTPSLDEAFASLREKHEAISKHHDEMADMLDNIEAKMPTLKGNVPLPQPRPRSAGPDAAGNKRSAKAWYDQ